MLGELTGEDETDRSLDLARRESRLVVDADKLAGLSSDALEDVVDERVHDRHSTARDTGVGVHLLEDLVDVRGVGFGSLLGALLGGVLGLAAFALAAFAFSASLGRCHFDNR